LVRHLHHQAIELSKSLRVLNLRSNNIGSVGGQALVNAVRHCATLRVLCLTDNKAGVEVIAQLSALLQGSILDVCRSVRHLELDIPQYHRDRDVDKERH
jgi:Ran GTPase-activating protein (RanGAP) involved in mRNA processing and transport